MNKYALWSIKFVVPVLGLVLTIWSIFFLGGDRQLSYELVSKTEIGSIKSKHLPGIQISYGGNPIERGGIITINITNTGDSPIYPREFDGPLEIHLDAESDFLDSKAVSTTPENLKPSLSTNKGIIEIAPLLLNPNDEITLQAIAKGNLKSIRVIARIGGINEVTDANEGKLALLSGFSWLLVIYALLCFVPYSLFSAAYIGGKVPKGNTLVSFRAAILITSITFLSGVVALVSFTQINSIEFRWRLILPLFLIIIICEVISIPFRPKEESEDVKEVVQ